MVRTQIQLTEGQAQNLKETALSSNDSMSSLIRQAIDRFLMTDRPNRAAQYRQALELAGKYKADRQDASVEHDQYLTEAY